MHIAGNMCPRMVRVGVVSVLENLPLVEDLVMIETPGCGIRRMVWRKGTWKSKVDIVVGLLVAKMI